MISGPSLNVAPSSSLLRFLRSQSEELCYFTPSRAVICNTPRARGTRVAIHGPIHDVPKGTRKLTTTPRQRATVESSLLNFESLRSLKHGLPSIATPSTAHHPSKPSVFTEGCQTNRHGSTDSRSLLKRLWKPKERKEKPGLRTSDLPPLPSFLDEVGGTSIGRNKSAKIANELKLRCTEFDKEGKVTLMDGEFKKTELIAKVCAP